MVMINYIFSFDIDLSRPQCNTVQVSSDVMLWKSCVGLESLSIATNLVGGVRGESKLDVGSPSGQELNGLVDCKWLGDQVIFIQHVGCLARAILKHLYPFPAYLRGDSNWHLHRPMGAIQLRVVISSKILVDGGEYKNIRSGTYTFQSGGVGIGQSRVAILGCPGFRRAVRVSC